MRRVQVVVAALFVCLLAGALSAQTKSAPKKSTAAKKTTRPAGVATDGTVKGTLTLNGEKFPLTHVYGRKREAWPADAKLLEADNVGELSCGIVELLFVNTALSEETIAAILQNDYKGSEKIRGVRFVIDGSGKYKWESMYLEESGAVAVYGMTQTSGSIEAGRRYVGEVSSRNQQVTQTRLFEVSFDTGVKVQYLRTEAEGLERIPESRLTEEFLKTLPGEWEIVRWLGISCTTAAGRLSVGERTSPHAFQARFQIALSNGTVVEEDAILSVAGSMVHVEGGKVSPPDVWMRDVLDLELYENLLIGNNATDFVVLQKMP
jgi:hypothetical protein